VTPSPYFTLPELAQFIRRSRSYCYKKAKAGKIPSVRMDGQWLFDREIIREWVATSGKPKQVSSLTRFQQARERLRSLKTESTAASPQLLKGER
jgi:excisionase family DNA binding protein